MTALRDGRPHWSMESQLLDDLRMTLEAVNTEKGKPKPKPHPDRRQAKRRPADSPERARKLAAARRRARQRRQRVSAGEIQAGRHS